MSKYSAEYMRENFRVGFRDQLGPAWWDSVDATTGEYVTFPGAIPMDVAHGMLGWEPEKVALMREMPDGTAMPLRKGWGDTPVALVNPNTGNLVGIMDENYPATSYAERLLDGLSAILDDPDLNIGSVLLLDGGSKASVQITLGNLTEVSNDTFKLWLAAYTSLDGKLKTTFKKGATRIQCDNTFDMFTREAGAKYAYKNTANSGLNITSAREALDIFTDMSAQLSATVDRMTSSEFVDAQWSKLLEEMHPTEGKEKSALTRAEKRQMALSDIYYNDSRVSDFTGTQWGAFQAFSTFNLHESTVRENDNEFQRNARKLLTGQTFDHDLAVMTAIDKVAALV